MDKLKNKFYGCFFGSIVGDALGMPYEFKKASEITYEPIMQSGGPFNLPKGCWTDDTSMMLCLAKSLIEKQGFDAQHQLLKYLCWYEDGINSATGVCFDIGAQTEEALLQFSFDTTKIVADHQKYRAGNGALMRINPIPLVYGGNSEKLKVVSELSTITTHNNDQCIISSGLCCTLIDLIITCNTHKEVLKHCFPLDETAFDVDGYVYGSLCAAMHCFYTTNSFEDCMEAIIKLGGDTDTNACIAGMLAGAYYGFDSIPKEWINDLVKLEELHEVCDQLFELRIKLNA